MNLGLAPPGRRPLRIAVLGAGMSGINCARRLADAGHQISVFEKSRGVGGRMATRRLDSGITLDHGAQYFTARDERFVAQVSNWVNAGHAELWLGKVGVFEANSLRPTMSETTLRWVGKPTMNAPCRALSEGLEIHRECRVTKVERVAGVLKVQSEDGRDFGAFDGVAVSAPADQAAAILADFPKVVTTLSRIRYAPCLAMMIVPKKRIDFPFDGCFVNGHPISWICRNSSKPGREGQESWVVHASPTWSLEHFDGDPAAWREVLLENLRGILHDPLDGVMVETHRWKYAQPLEGSPRLCIWESELGVGVCGDAFGDSRVEGAFLIGWALAAAIDHATTQLTSK